MDTSDNDILQLRFEGNGINPERLKPSEVCDMVIELQNALLATIKYQHPEIDTSVVLFSLDNIKHESLGINFKALTERILPEVKDVVVASFLTIAQSVATNDVTALPQAAVHSLKKISTFSKKHDCNGYFNHNGQTLSTITPSTEIKEKKIYTIKSALKIYGEVTDVGSNVHIKLNDGSNVLVDTDKATAKKLGAYLWDIVGLAGVAKWDTETLKILEFKLTEILDYSPKNLSEIFSKIRESESGWDKFGNDEEVNRQLLRD